MYQVHPGASLLVVVAVVVAMDLSTLCAIFCLPNEFQWDSVSSSKRKRSSAAAAAAGTRQCTKRLLWP